MDPKKSDEVGSATKPKEALASDPMPSDNTVNEKDQTVSSSAELAQPVGQSAGNNTDQQSKDNASSQETKPLSKNQRKRQQKWANAMEVKRRRKEQEKNIKLAKAKAEGRDIEAERREMEIRRKDGAGWARRNEKWKEIFKKSGNKHQICLDCSFEDQMTKKEINSLSSQIRYCYASNKKSANPVITKVTDLTGETLQNLQNVSGFENWKFRAFEHTEKDLLEAYEDKSKLVYLTSDSENVLEALEDDKVYIIGGIVDRNRLKRAAIDRAEKLDIATAKLPISDYLSMCSTKVLTCNHVFEILLKFRECDSDWKKTLMSVLPVRKDAKEKD